MPAPAVRPSPPAVPAAAAPRGGLGYMALSAFWFSVMTLCVKLGGRRLPSQELVLVRAVLTLAMSWAALRQAGLPLRSASPARQRDLVLRGVFGTLGLTCFYWSVVHLPLAEATLLQYTNPIWAALLAAVLLRERVGVREAACLAASLVGVVLVVRPGPLAAAGAHAVIAPAAALLALVGALGSAAAYVVIRRMGTAEDPQRVTLYLPLVTVPVTLPFVVGAWVAPTPREWAILVAMSVATQLAQVCMTRGLQREPAARATAVGYLQLVFAAAWGWLVFGERPGPWTAAGAATIVAGTLALALRPRRRAGGDAAGSAAEGAAEPPALAAALASEAETAEAP